MKTASEAQKEIEEQKSKTPVVSKGYLKKWYTHLAGRALLFENIGIDKTISIIDKHIK